MPVLSCFLPILKPLCFCSRTDKELHFHLFKLSHTEDKLSCNYLISESLTNLCNTKRNLHSACFLNIKVLYKNTLSCFWAKVNSVSIFRNRTHLSRKH